MIYIRISDLQIDDEWQNDAQEKTTVAQGLSMADRREYMRSQTASNVWGQLKPRLAALSQGKCWYCETFDRRSFGDVDHFRPKSKVAGCQNHPGYWWLAFDHLNFRYSCTLCNRLLTDPDSSQALGKGTKFPLLDEATRVWDQDGNIRTEHHSLLDPTVASDPGLLWFDEDGRSVPRHEETEQERLHRRAAISIDVYNLNHVNIVEARRTVCNEVKRLVDDGSEYWKRYAEGDHTVERAFKRVFETLCTMVDGRAEYSACARATLLGLRDHTWVEDVLRVA